MKTTKQKKTKTKTDRILKHQGLALHVDSNLFCQVPGRNTRAHLCDVSDLLRMRPRDHVHVDDNLPPHPCNLHVVLIRVVKWNLCSKLSVKGCLLKFAYFSKDPL